MLSSTVAASAGITYQTFNDWMKKGKKSESGEYFEFYEHIKKCNADGALKCLQCLNNAAEADDTRICIWILERRFPEDFGRREYRKINAVSENKNENVDIIVNDGDVIRKQILAKLTMVRDCHESPTG
jgi:hypothetical protein